MTCARRGDTDIVSSLRTDRGSDLIGFSLLRTFLNPSYPLSYCILCLARTDTTFVPRAGWRRGLVENGRHGDSAQLYPFALGKAVSRPPPAGPHHADEGQHLCPRQLGVPAGNPEV